MIDSTNLSLIAPTPKTTGDARRPLLESLVAVKNGDMSATQGMSIASIMKVLNDSIQVELNAVKLHILTEGTVNEFGKLMPIGKMSLLSDE